MRTTRKLQNEGSQLLREYSLDRSAEVVKVREWLRNVVGRVLRETLALPLAGSRAP